MSNRYFISYPSSEATNHFIKLLNNELKKGGWIESSDNVWRNIFLSIKNRKKNQIIYFHWPETFWRHKSLIISCLKSIVFICHVVFWKIIGYKLVFSAHNVLPHYGKTHFKLELFMRRYIIFTFDLVVGHSYNTFKDLISTVGYPRKYVLCLHGIYAQPQVPRLNTANIERKLFLPYSSHEYKGTETFLVQFSSLNKDILTNIELVISGNVPNSIKKMLQHRAIRYKIIESANGSYFLSENELRRVISICDMVVLPYKEITNSGFFFMALTMGKGIIATDLPFFRLHGDAQMQLLFDIESLKSLSEKIGLINQGWIPNADILKELQIKYSWAKSAKILAQKFNEIL